MIQIQKMSPSAYSKWGFCSMQYFFSYCLGYREPSKKRTEFGTIVHKVMEVLALMKKNHQETGVYETEDEVVGKISCSDAEWLEERKMTMIEVARANTSRSNKYFYKSVCRLDNGHKVYGEQLVKTILDRAYNYYMSKHHETWGEEDYNDVTNLTWMVLEYRNGMYDPRRMKIVQTEHEFFMPIEKPWAKVEGTESGYLEIKGVIDLIIESEVGTLEIVDWKSGARKDWGTGEIKDYDYLSKDLQLLTYYYAARKLFPDKHIGVTIFFIRDGGPFTFWHEDEMTIKVVEDKIQARFEEIKNCDLPPMCDPTQKSDKCRKFCQFYKDKSPDGKLKNMCQHIHNEIKVIGIDETIKKYKQEKEKQT